MFSRTPARQEAFAERMGAKLDLPISASESPEEALEGADIIITVTTSREPVFPGRLVQPGTHINAAGSNHVMRREIDAESVRKADLVDVDSIDQAQVEAGDLTEADVEGHFDWRKARELQDVLAGSRPGRTSADEITLRVAGACG